MQNMGVLKVVLAFLMISVVILGCLAGYLYVNMKSLQEEKEFRANALEATLIGFLNELPLSKNLNNYKYIDNPVIARVAKTWESVDVGHFAVLPPSLTHDGNWHGWYAGYDGTYMKIGHATSDDGISWVKDPANPVLSLSDKWVNDPFVIPIVEEGLLVYHMFFEVYDPATKTYYIGKAKSADAAAWTGVREVLKAQPKLANEVGVSVPLVHRDDATGKWFMLFSGIVALEPKWIIWTGLAESNNGEEWTKVEVIKSHLGKFIYPHAVLKTADAFVGLFVTDTDEIQPGASQDFKNWVILPKSILSKSEAYEYPIKGKVGIGTDGLALTHYEGKYYLYYSYYTNAAGNRDIGVIVVEERPPFTATLLKKTSIAAGTITTLDDCRSINLSEAKVLALTVECVFAFEATDGVRVHIRTSVDDSIFDSQDLKYFDLAVEPGTTIRKTVSVDTNAKYLKVLVENLDTAHVLSKVKVIATMG